MPSVGCGEDREAGVGVAGGVPVAFVDEPVVEGAQPGAVVDAGDAPVSPMVQVVELAGWSSAVGVGAAVAVADAGGADLGGGPDPAGAADVEDLACAAEDGGQDLGVAGEPPRRLGGDPQPGLQRRPLGFELADQGLVVEGDDDAGSFPGRVGQGLVGVDVVGGDVAEGVVAALGQGPVVVGVFGSECGGGV